MKKFKNDFIAFATASHSLKPHYNDNGSIENFTFKYYVDYHDKNYIADLISKQSDINSDTINDIIEHLHDTLHDQDYYYINGILSDFLEEFPQYNDMIDYHDIIDNFDIFGNISDYVNLIYDSYINVNILLNTHDDLNSDYSNNNSIDIINALQSENYIDYKEWIRDSSIVTLLNSQGIPEHVFYQYITSGSEKSNKFLDTLYNELLNGYKYEAVTFFTKMTVSDYLKLKDSKAFIIPKDINCGLVGFLDGSGSVLNIELQNDITLKHDQVIIEVDGAHNYSIMQIYGLVGYNEVDITIIEEGNSKNE